MTRYIVKLSEQEELNLRQMTTHPGYDALLKLLQGESLDAQAEAMECRDADKEKRLLLLTDAQVTKRVVSSITQKLSGYRESFMPTAAAEENTEDPFGFSMFTGKDTH